MAIRITIVILPPRFISLKKLSFIVYLNGSVVERKQYVVLAMIEIGVKIGKKM